MRYRVIIEREEIGEGWTRVHERVTEIRVAEVAARKIEQIIKDEGLHIDPRELRDILAAELGE